MAATRHGRRLESEERGSIGDELEAFLAGRYVRFVRDRHREIPWWAWVNRLAHGTSDEVTALGTRRVRRRDEWGRAEQFLAQEIMVLARGDLAGLQRSGLVPLELKLAEDDGCAAVTALQFAARVLLAIP
jgi:hypothetical protein